MGRWSLHVQGTNRSTRRNLISLGVTQSRYLQCGLSMSLDDLFWNRPAYALLSIHKAGVCAGSAFENLPRKVGAIYNDGGHLRRSEVNEMSIPGFTAEAALRQMRRSRVTTDVNLMSRDYVTMAANGLDPVDEEIAVACGPCRCRVHRFAKIPEIICSKNCCSPRERGCDSWSIPCVPWNF